MVGGCGHSVCVCVCHSYSLLHYLLLLLKKKLVGVRLPDTLPPPSLPQASCFPLPPHPPTGSMVPNRDVTGRSLMWPGNRQSRPSLPQLAVLYFNQGPLNAGVVVQLSGTIQLWSNPLIGSALHQEDGINIHHPHISSRPQIRGLIIECVNML